MKTITLTTMEDTAVLASELARKARPGHVYTLAGDVGAGKTAFARFFIQALSRDAVEVTSPTFNVLQTYPVQLASGETSQVWHYDLYRIEHPSALIELGFDEALGYVSIIEWPQKLHGMRLPIAAALNFRLTSAGREVTIEHDL